MVAHENHQSSAMWRERTLCALLRLDSLSSKTLKVFYYLKDKAVESSCGLKCWRPLFHSPAKLTSQSCTSHDRSFGNPSHVDRISVSMFKSKHAKLVLLNCQSVKNSFFEYLLDCFWMFSIVIILLFTRMRFLLRKMTIDIYIGIGCLRTFIKVFMPTQSPSTDVPC